MIHKTRFATVLALGASASMAAMPVAAAELPMASSVNNAPTVGAWEDAAVSADRYRGRYRRNRGVDAGDVLAGVLILGGIAAVASAASKANNRNRDYRNNDYRTNDTRYRNQRGDSRYNGTRGIDNAVNMCVTQIERDIRVENVNSVDRNGEGWRVTGALYNGEGFVCRIGSDGRIEGIDYGQGYAYNSSAPAQSGQTADRQWDDARYAQAWQDADNTGGQQAPNYPVQGQQSDQGDRLPAYPGGPIDGGWEDGAGG